MPCVNEVGVAGYLANIKGVCDSKQVGKHCRREMFLLNCTVQITISATFAEGKDAKFSQLYCSVLWFYGSLLWAVEDHSIDHGLA